MASTNVVPLHNCVLQHRATLRLLYMEMVGYFVTELRKHKAANTTPPLQLLTQARELRDIPLGGPNDARQSN